jgi:peptide deformylase
MAILKIARMGHPVLKRRADPVQDVKSPEIQRLIQDMLDTLTDIGGAGLAAPQVHVPLRLVIFHVPEARAAREDGESGGGAVPMTVLINPEIEPLGPEMAPGLEACLSVPGLAGMVPRHTHIRYRGLDAEGRVIDREARGFHARVVQHECDHLDGVLYPMRMTDLSTLTFVEEMRRAADSDEQPVVDD